MFKPILTPREIAERYNRFLPEEIRQYLKGRGLPATVIDRALLGWDSKRITIPIFGRSPHEVLGFRYAKLREHRSGAPEIISDREDKPELYGWETLARGPHRIVICEDEFDRLVLEARGFPAVTSTGGAKVFLEAWAEDLKEITDIFICFKRASTSDRAARNVQRILPQARIARLPAEVGENGSVSTFFIDCEMTEGDFEVVLAKSESAIDDPADRPPQVRVIQPVHRSLKRRAERVRQAVRLHEVVSRFTNLHAAGSRLVGHCPFHDEPSPTFTVYPQADTYQCSVCGTEGDVVRFLMDKESMTFGQALQALECFEITHELYDS